MTPPAWKRAVLAARSSVERRVSGLPPSQDEMGRGPRVAAPCPPLATLLESYGETGSAPEILLFGDSTSVLTSPWDLSRQTLAKMLSRRMRPWRTISIAGVAYHPGVYSSLTGAL